MENNRFRGKDEWMNQVYVFGQLDLEYVCAQLISYKVVFSLVKIKHAQHICLARGR